MNGRCAHRGMKLLDSKGCYRRERREDIRRHAKHKLEKQETNLAKGGAPDEENVKVEEGSTITGRVQQTQMGEL
jgi:hypothetical protein